MVTNGIGVAGGRTTGGIAVVETMMVNESNGSGPAGERLSALVDGEVDAGAAAEACDAWRGDAAARRDWHAYQVIGDVLRSEDLAVGIDRDAAFLRSLRLRLAQEPVVLAPAPLGRPADRARWRVPAAVAAGFVLVAGTFTVLRPMAPPAAVDRVAAASRVDPAPAALVADPTSADRSASTTLRQAEPTVVADGRVLRDARLDRYLAAHKQFAGSTALGVPSGFLRSATADGR